MERPIEKWKTGDLIAGEALLNAAANVYNEARTKLPRDEQYDAVWRSIIKQREDVINELLRRRDQRS